MEEIKNCSTCKKKKCEINKLSIEYDIPISLDKGFCSILVPYEVLKKPGRDDED